MAEKKSNNTKVMAIIGIAFLGLLVLMLLAAPPQAPKPAESDVAAEATTPADETAATDATIDVAEALSDRILGDVNAPLKIVEFASLTCSHCGDFHRNTFDQIKTNYIDTGKAYFIFSEFPLNKPAVEATKISRCLPKDKYFEFTSMLFKEQEAWTGDQNYLAWLKEKARDAGLSPEKFDACLANTELEEGITNRMKAAQDRWKISSTPSFVINDATPIAGAYPYDSFDQLLKEELAKANGTAPVPATPDPSAPETIPPSDAPAAPTPDPAVTPDAAPAPVADTPADTESPAETPNEE